MKQLNWGDELAGKVITPEEWRTAQATGIVECGTGGVWHRIDSTDRKMHRPIYPPAGWAGKTEAELWDEMTENGAPIHCGGAVFLLPWNPTALTIEQQREDGPTAKFADTYLPAASLLEAHILGCQNAMVLSKRLKGAR